MGLPVIYDENGEIHKYKYPRTILADIQKRPNLPPDTQEPGANYLGILVYSFEYPSELENAYRGDRTVEPSTGKEFDKYFKEEETALHDYGEELKTREW